MTRAEVPRALSYDDALKGKKSSKAPRVPWASQDLALPPSRVPCVRDKRFIKKDLERRRLSEIAEPKIDEGCILCLREDDPSCRRQCRNHVSILILRLTSSFIVTVASWVLEVVIIRWREINFFFDFFSSIFWFSAGFSGIFGFSEFFFFQSIPLISAQAAALSRPLRRPLF